MKGGTETSAVIDGIMRFIVGGGTITTILAAPGMAEVLDKPTLNYFNKLDKRAQRRELKRLVYYMKQKGLVYPTSEEYMHGIVVTKKGLERLKTIDFETLQIPTPTKWDNKWRLVLFDIPEHRRAGRRVLISKLKAIGFLQLQRSVWVHPLPCRAEIEVITHHYNIARYVSYIDATGIDNHDVLVKKFKTILTQPK